MALRIALDANRYVDFCRGVLEATDVVRRAGRIFLPFTVLGELRAGFALGTRSAENEANLIRFLASPRVTALWPDDQSTHHYGRLFRQLRTQGTPIPTNDLWTAALVVQHGLYLCARDAHFDHLPQIPRA